jgi:hypothetical protein
MNEEYYVVRIKGHELYFNDTSELGEHLSETPALLSNREANLVIRYFNKLEHPHLDRVFSRGDLEIILVKLSLKT